MASMVRKIMRNIFRSGNRSQMGGGIAVGSHRAGMHQASEHAYQRKRMAEAMEPEPETVENALDMPAALEAEIPPVEEDDDEIVEEIAENEAGIEAETEITEEIADPDAAENEELEGSEEITLSVDYSGEKIPVLDPVIEGASDPETELVYTSQDGDVKEIQEPLPGMTRYGVAPYIPGADNPSGNVGAVDSDLDDLGSIGQEIEE